MKFSRSESRLSQRAATRAELLFVVVVLMAAGFVAAARILPRQFQKAARISCVGRLKNIGLAVRIYATDNNDLFPFSEAATNRSAFDQLTVSDYFRALSNGLSTPKILQCPSDRKRSHAERWPGMTDLNVSYFVNVSASETNSKSLLAGDRDLHLNEVRLKPGHYEVLTSHTLRWAGELHRGLGNVAMGDGSVQQLDDERMTGALQGSGVATNRILLP